MSADPPRIHPIVVGLIVRDGYVLADLGPGRLPFYPDVAYRAALRLAGIE